ncbi:voltage-dependent T-type calcium channel subunit alpha-1G-like isoform X2 [Argopecten irradians]|uniref:voltage-dependent T-type calcium channel subunit alpha-1G-like isoform X2 n=1 Tax=Argopecten irradians TaxID=31199 RepID=UPI003717D77A
MAVILLNCVTLGMYQPCEDQICDTMRCQVLEKFDHFIFAFFAIEMIIKIVAMGLWGKLTYLDDSWNRLDCFIVLAGSIEYGVDSENLSLSAIRTIRVLRPLRAINRIPSMRILVMLLLDTLPMLGNVLLLCFFVFFIFGIIGVQLWAGVLRNRCFLNISENISYAHANLSPYFIPKKLNQDYICSMPGESGMRQCRNFYRYEYEGIRCNGSAKPFSNNTPTNDSCINWNQYYTTCMAGDKNPFQGAISFDNIGLAWVAIFQVISLESWVNIMYYVQDAHSFWDWTYFVALIVIGSFFMINLCLVVIATQFSETKKRETERMMQERKRFHSSSTLASNSEPGGCYSEILKYLAHLWRRAKRDIVKFYYEARGRTHPHRKIKPELSLRKRKKKGTRYTKSGLSKPGSCPCCSHRCNYYYHILNTATDKQISRRNSSPLAPRASPEMSDIESVSSPQRPNFLTVPSMNSVRLSSSDSVNTLALAATDALGSSLLKSSPNHLALHAAGVSRTSSFTLSRKHLPSLPEMLATHCNKNATLASTNTLLQSSDSCSCSQSRLHHKGCHKGLPEDLLDVITDKQISSYLVNDYDKQSQCNHSSPHDNCDMDKDRFDIERRKSSDKKKNKKIIWENENQTWDCEECRQKSTLGNTIAGGLALFQNFMEKVVEHQIFQRGIMCAILVNTVGMGIEYHNQPMELTQAVEYSNVVFCVLFALEMLFKLMAYGLFGYIQNGFNVFDGFIVILSIIELLQEDENSGLSVLRTFRLLRILKLVRFMPALRRQLVVMLRTMDNVATFFALLVLFIFIFSVLGMNLFGGKFCWRDEGIPCTCADESNPALRCVCDRANFNSLLWSLVTVFQVLTQEDWNTVLYNGMETTSAWASLYFIALMTFGNYVLFNLLVAILVEGFSTDEEEKKKMRECKVKEVQSMTSETNNNEEKSETIKLKTIDMVQVKINNKEKEKMLAMCPVTIIKEENKTKCPPPAPEPPIITHTAATPMPTPQGSPNEHGSKDYNKATLHPPRGSTSSKSSSTNLSVRSSPRLSPRVSPCLRRSQSYGSRNSWKGRRSRDGDRRYLVPECKFDSMDTDDDDVFQPIILNNRSECNGHLPLNNQRALSPQNSIKRPPFPSPRNSIKIRNNSMSSTQSMCNSIILSRQNSFTSHRTINSLSSMNGIKDDYKQNNLSPDPPTNTTPESEEEEEDPDAIDEANCTCSWCPEPKGCFKTREEYSLYLFHPNNRLRRLCHHFMAQSLFDNMILLFIALNCITLGMERPDIPPDSTERMFLTYSNYCFTIVFAVEMTIKVLAKGLLIGKHAYLKSGWNIMDGFLVGISLVDIMISLTANSSPRIFGILRVFRLLRTLRPLRVISRAPGLKLVVQTLLSSLRPIGNIVLICCTFFIIFGILGVQLFKGSFYYCKGPDVQHVKNKTQCLKDQRNIWINQKYNFDNLGQALMALFVLASKDGWVSIMYTGLDAVGVDQQPQINYNEWRLLYFISFLLLVGFFVLNMFVGVVVENFHKCRENQEKEERAIRAAKRSQKMEAKRKKLNRPPYWANYNKCRLLIHAVVNSKYFDLAIAGVIGLNVITMAMEYYMMPAELQFALKIFNYFFTSVFIIEATMKIIALGMMRYIKDRWNQLDILIVLLSIVGIVLEEMKTNVIPINPTIIRVMRVLRIARVLKLLKMAKSIRALLDTVIQALPQVGNLGLLFFLLFFIFAALGVELFGRLECSLNHPCEGLGEHAHFRDFGMAFLTLFRVATGDNWNGIMKDTLREDCDDSAICLTNCCVSPIIAPVYFVIFVLMAQFVLVNVVVAVLMKHLEETYKYKELDDEVEEELRNEMDDKNKTEIFELKYQESHRMVDEDDMMDGDGKDEDEEEKEESTGGDVNVKDEEMEMMLKVKTPVPPYIRKLKSPVCKQASLPPSFTFRPPSNEPQDENEPIHGPLLVPVDITISSFDSSVDLSGSSTLDVPLTPSTCYSENSSYMEGSAEKLPRPGKDNSSYASHIPQKNYLNPNTKTVSPQQKQRFKDRKLVRQKSCDYDSPPITEETVSTRGKLLLSPCQKYREKVSQSQPSLLIVGMDAHRGSKMSKLSGCPNRRRLSYLQRSQSSGAEKAKVRDRFCSGANPHRPHNHTQRTHSTKGYSVLHPMAQEPTVYSHPVQCSTDKPDSNTSSSQNYPHQLNRSSTCDSQSNDCSTTSDWTGDEAACDEEVRKITGDDTEEEELGDDLADFSPDIPGERTLLLAEAAEEEAALSSSSAGTSGSRQSILDSHESKHLTGQGTTDAPGGKTQSRFDNDRHQMCKTETSPSDTSGSRQSILDLKDENNVYGSDTIPHQLLLVPSHVRSTDTLSIQGSNHCPDRNSSHHGNQNNKCNGGQASVLVHPLSSGEPLVDLEQDIDCDKSESGTSDKGNNSDKLPVIRFEDPLSVHRRRFSTKSEDGGD